MVSCQCAMEHGGSSNLSLSLSLSLMSASPVDSAARCFGLQSPVACAIAVHEGSHGKIQ